MRKSKTNWEKLKSLTEEEIEKAAKSDPDSYIPTQKELKEFKRVHPNKKVDVKKIRSKLGLTQVQFGIYFGVSGRTIQQWEQKRRYPSAASRNFLRVIESEPKAVQRALLKEENKNEV